MENVYVTHAESAKIRHVLSLTFNHAYNDMIVEIDTKVHKYYGCISWKTELVTVANNLSTVVQINWSTTKVDS